MTNELKNPREKAWYADSLRLFGRLSAWIALPVVLASFLGKWLDKKYETEPWLLLVCIGFSFVVSMVVLVKEAVREIGSTGGDNSESLIIDEKKDKNIN